MRVAVVSDIHGNLTALEAVLADVREQAPDLVLHGGDLSDSGSSPAEVIDRIRDLGWQGVMGNTDEMLVRPESLGEFASQSRQRCGQSASDRSQGHRRGCGPLCGRLRRRPGIRWGRNGWLGSARCLWQGQNQSTGRVLRWCTPARGTAGGLRRRMPAMRSCRRYMDR